MIKFLARRTLQAFSVRYQYDTRYLEELLAHDLVVFLKFAALNILSSHRRGIPEAPWWAARIRSALWEDCGPCVQLVCTMALEAGIDAAAVGAIVASDLAALNEETALALRFTEAVLARDSAADALREEVRQRWGQDGLVSLAMAISTTRVYPSVKYVLGHGHTCSRVEIARRTIAPATFQSTTLPGTALTGISR